MFLHHKRSMISKSKKFNPCPITLSERTLCQKSFSRINSPNINNRHKNSRKFETNAATLLTLDADSRYADIAVHGDGLTSLQYRMVKGGVTEELVLYRV